MKQLFLMLTVALFVASCSSDDDGGTNPPTNPPTDNTGNYFPLTVDDYWNYDVEYTDNNDSNNNSSSSDFLYVASETNGSFDLGVNTNDIANGAMNGILVNGTLERTESTLVLDGSISIPFPGFETSSIDFTDMVLYDLNAANNSQLASTSGSIDQNIDLGTDVIPVTINYTVSTTQINNNSSVSVGGTNYTGVSKARFKLNLNVIATILNPITNQPQNLNILGNQDVTVGTNYFVENIGLVKSETAINYQVDQTTIELLTLFGIDIPFPTSGSATNVQEMTDYMVAEE
ncbi:hypothetical protein [Hanstruepera ponticola]|uniref:hypothetical protein n=1 Tax=Hanstruepera ponticola TaxID=2042995 RepID=UPI0017857C06|nr:hypothetical protein [Hanstruepera ponticola]